MALRRRQNGLIKAQRKLDYESESPAERARRRARVARGITQIVFALPYTAFAFFEIYIQYDNAVYKSPNGGWSCVGCSVLASLAGVCWFVMGLRLITGKGRVSHAGHY